MADELTKKDEEVPATPATDAKELTDEELAKVSGGGAVVEDRVAVKQSTTLSAGTLKAWGDPH